MVNVYDASDLSECAVFVNRGMLEQDGTWSDNVALRALLAHEHGHPLAENETVRAARELTVEGSEEGEASPGAAGEVLHLLAAYLCLRAPQEVFSNEIAIRAGFGSALLHLNRDAIETARLGVGKRPSLVQSLDKQVADGRLSTGRAAALLLVGDLQANLGFALETAAFRRAGDQRAADALDEALNAGVWPRLDPIAKRLYENLRDHCVGLKPDLTPTDTNAWVSEAVALLADALRERGSSVRLNVVRRGNELRRGRGPKSDHAATHGSIVDPDGGSL